MNQLTTLDMPNLNKTRLKRKNIRIRQRKRCRVTLPADLPVGTSSPPVAVHEEGEVAVVEQEFSVHSLDVDGFHVLFASYEVEGCVGLVEEGLGFCGFETDDFEASGTADTEG